MHAIRNTVVRKIAVLGVAGCAGMALLGTTATVAAPAVAGGPAPMIAMQRLFSASRPPTTADCEQQFGLACYVPAQMRAAYNLAPLYAHNLTGTGETIAIVDSFGSPTIAHDLEVFDKAFKLNAPPSLKVIQPAGKVPKYDPSNPVMAGWASETTLDVEWAHTVAPDANILLVETPVAETEGVVGFPQIVKAENYVIDHDMADVISQSFGATEATFPGLNSVEKFRKVYENADANNVTVLASSGDTGATNYMADGVSFYTHAVDSWPSSDPLVTSVGGTQLHLDSKGARTAADNVWNDDAKLGGPTAGGGGMSAFFKRPTFQNGVSSAVGDVRGSPDVSMSAACDGAVVVYHSFGGQATGWYLICGTSEASPLFSGVVAIADQAAGTRLGFLNDNLYALGAGSPGLPDVTKGTNTVTFTQSHHTYTVKGWKAVSGYDLSSGLGTIDANALVTALAH